MIKTYSKPPRSSERDLKGAIEEARRGEYPYSFVIVGLAPAFFQDQGVCSYQMVISPEQEEMVGYVTKEVAMAIIKKNGMKRVHSCAEGRVYECPDHSFIAAWEGYNATKLLRHVWHHIEGDERFPRCDDKRPIWARYRGNHEVEVIASDVILRFLRKIEKESETRAGLAFQRFFEERKVIYKNHDQGR